MRDLPDAIIHVLRYFELAFSEPVWEWAKGIYRDAVRSSKSFFVKTSGLRWVSMMLLAPIPWAKRVWALPFLTVLAPSERYHQERGLPHKKLTDWARQMLLQARRWFPRRTLVGVGDSS